ncbi:MAG: hypothetical protein WC374_06530, partial [Phycisphaerae bacterium]
LILYCHFETSLLFAPSRRLTSLNKSDIICRHLLENSPSRAVMFPFDTLATHHCEFLYTANIALLSG